MDFKIKRKSTKTSENLSLVENYPHDLQMYKVPPTRNISLSDFEAITLDRLKLLRILETATTLKGLRLYSDDWKEFILRELRSQGLKYYSKLCEKTTCGRQKADLQAREKDHISHFILRLAHCRTEEKRRWFIARELELFRMRFISMESDAMKSFFNINNLYYTNISDEECNDLNIFLRESTSYEDIDKLKFYKVKFYEVLDLVRARRVFLKGGYAYVPDKDFISVLTTQFRTHLKQTLAIARHHMEEIEQDERLVGLMKGLHLTYLGKDYSDTKVAVPIESIDTVLIKSFPLCMRQLHEMLRSTHHLKHGGRLQYGLFLKGIGVTLEDSLKFWREEFTKIMEPDKFEKSYSYNIRYNYGKEGSKKDYSPFNCLKIINSNVGPGDCHGCPFRHCDANSLKNRLKGYGLEVQAINDIIDMAKKGHFQVSCSKYFDAVHNTDLGLGINHPNEFYEESQKIIKSGIKVEPNKDIKQNVVKKDQRSNDFEDMDYDEIAEHKE